MQRGIYVLLALVGTLAACQPDPKTNHSPAKESATPTAAGAAGGWAGKVDSLTAAQLPPLEKLPGQLLEARRWTDAQGENVLVIYRTKPVSKPGTDTDMESRTVQLFARQYLRPAADGPYRELWRLQDGIQDCPFDLDLGPLPGSTAITDLDHDGQTETTLVYKLACRSDVSPSDLKLIMREGPAKYALRGFTVVQYDSVPLLQRAPANACCLDTISKAELNEHYELNAGRYENEKDFRGAPRAFLGFARAHWRRWMVRDLDSGADTE